MKVGVIILQPIIKIKVTNDCFFLYIRAQVSLLKKKNVPYEQDEKRVSGFIFFSGSTIKRKTTQQIF